MALRVKHTDDDTVTEDIYYIHNDHLGSNSLLSPYADDPTTPSIDERLQPEPGSEARYLPFGDWRVEPTASKTDRGYTGHKHNNIGAGDFGLIYMNARYYVPGIGKFASADTIIPNPMNPQSYNRYSYVLNNPIKFTDPSGHRECEFDTWCAPGSPESNYQPLQPPLPTLPFTPPSGLTDRPFPYGSAGPGGLQAYNGLQTLEDEGGGWWGEEIDAQEAMVILLNHEFGNLIEIYGGELPQAIIEVAANRYETYCADEPWSAECFNGFWAYVHPITELEIRAPARQNARSNPHYSDDEIVTELNVTARSILNGSVEGSKTPFHYGNAVLDAPAFLNGEREAYWMYTYESGGEVYLIFVVLTSNQHTGTLR